MRLQLNVNESTYVYEPKYAQQLTYTEMNSQFTFQTMEITVNIQT